MKKRKFLLAGLALAVAGAIGQAQIKRLSLTEMTNETDNGVLGTVVASRVVVEAPHDAHAISDRNTPANAV